MIIWTHEPEHKPVTNTQWLHIVPEHVTKMNFEHP